jgi:hypothetical protein
MIHRPLFRPPSEGRGPTFYCKFRKKRDASLHWHDEIPGAWFNFNQLRSM